MPRTAARRRSSTRSPVAAQHVLDAARRVDDLDLAIRDLAADGEVRPDGHRADQDLGAALGLVGDDERRTGDRARRAARPSGGAVALGDVCRDRVRARVRRAVGVVVRPCLRDDLGRLVGVGEDDDERAEPERRAASASPSVDDREPTPVAGLRRARSSRGTSSAVASMRLAIGASITGFSWTLSVTPQGAPFGCGRDARGDREERRGPDRLVAVVELGDPDARPSRGGRSSSSPKISFFSISTLGDLVEPLRGSIVARLCATTYAWPMICAAARRLDGSDSAPETRVGVHRPAEAASGS